MSVNFTTQIFRHGDRTPVEPYPNDPYKDPSLWPVGFGQLTNVSHRKSQISNHMRHYHGSEHLFGVGRNALLRVQFHADDNVIT